MQQSHSNINHITATATGKTHQENNFHDRTVFTFQTVLDGDLLCLPTTKWFLHRPHSQETASSGTWTRLRHREGCGCKERRLMFFMFSGFGGADLRLLSKTNNNLKNCRYWACFAQKIWYLTFRMMFPLNLFVSKEK